jgi:hypothetical protein
MVAATGLAVVSVAPFGGQGSPLPTTPPSSPAVVIKTASAVHHHAGRHVAQATQQARPAAALAAPAEPAGRGASHVASTRINAPHVCGQAGYSVNCYHHVNPTLYVGPPLPVPVAGIHRVGIASNKVDCTDVPTTAVTKCDTRGVTQ